MIRASLILCALLGAACAEEGAAPAVAPPLRYPPTPTTPCEVEDERVCDEVGSHLLVCAEGAWAQRACSLECAARGACSLGCLVAEEGEDCLCADLGPNCD